MVLKIWHFKTRRGVLLVPSYPFQGGVLYTNNTKIINLIKTKNYGTFVLLWLVL